MELSFIPTDFLTGKFRTLDLPLENVTMSSSVEVGSFSADLDLRRIVNDGDWVGAKHVLDAIQPGATTIVPVRQDLTAGHYNTVDKAMGEWMVTDVQKTHASPVVKIVGMEFTGYTRLNVVTRNWKVTGVDPVKTARELLTDLMTSGQTVAFDPNEWVSANGLKTDFEAQAGSVTYWDAIRDLAADDFEWHVDTNVLGANGIPTGVQRWLRFGEPTIRIPRDDVALEFVTPGKRPAAGLDMTGGNPIEAHCYDLWAFGSGAGTDQVKYRLQRDLPVRFPRLSRTFVARDVLKLNQLKGETRREMRRMNPVLIHFTATASMDLLPGGGPRVGHVYPFFREPSISMPTSESGGHVRVLEWEWSQPRPGEDEVAKLTLVRE